MSLLLGLRHLLGEFDDAAAPEPDPLLPDSERATVEIEAVPRRPVA